jgi:UDP-apiose/xylose synthase
MKIAVLGCGGFIASHLLERLLKTDRYQIVGWDTQDSKIKHLLDHKYFTFHKIDIYRDNELKAKIKDFDVVIHLAAICNPSQYNKVPLSVINSNFIDAHEIVSLCSQEKKWLIHFSTSEVYGRTLSSYLKDGFAKAEKAFYELDEDTTPFIMGPLSNQRWSYASAKQLLERFIYAHHYENNLDFTIIRPFNFFGPRMDFIPGVDGEGIPRVLASFIYALLSREAIPLINGGTARRTFIFIEDAVEPIELMLQNPELAKNEIFNIGNRNNEVTISELAHVIRDIWAEVTGDESFEQHPIREISGEEFYGPGYEDCDRRMPSLKKLEEKFGWKPKTDFKSMLKKTLSCYYENYYKHI